MANSHGAQWFLQMKALVLALLLLALLSTQLPSPALALTSCTSSSCTVTVSRSITTNNWGVTFVSDNFTLTTGTSSVSQITLGVPSALASRLRFTQAVDSQSNQLRISLPTVKSLPLPLVGNYSELDIAFPSAKTGTYGFNLTSVYSDLLSFNSTSSNFSFAFEPFPLTDGTYNVTSAQLSVKTGDWQSPKISSVNGTFASATFTAQTKTLQKFNTTVATMTFSSTTQSILDVVANRTITLAQTGSIQVTDFYNMTNKGHDLTSIALPVPKNVPSAIASDIIPSVATLAASTAPDGTTAVAFAPRFGPLKSGGSSLTRITYSLPIQSYLTSKGLGRFELSFRMLDNVRFVEPVLQMKIVTPVGFRLDSLSGQTFTTSGNQILIQVSTLTPMSNLSFSMDYQLDPFWASLSALGWAGLAVGSIAAIVLAVGATGTAGVSVSGAPSELIGRFVELYDEKSAMRLEAEKMDEDLSRGALNRHEFKRRRRVIDLRVAELDRTLAPIKDQLSKTNPRYQDMIKRLERAEADIQVVRTTSADLRNQYRSGRIARELYESLISDLAKRKEKAQQTMDTIVINLREETR
ncbi:MAG: hypothetical protein AUI97_01135 [Crenarchaeota archaeon 13_1_40CM_3_52_17]|nr:MAG: hypothetical protein AUI97_01135 [Crenarchaeota archaeon 13_1_40CM_3_52_17]